MIASCSMLRKYTLLTKATMPGAAWLTNILRCALLEQTDAINLKATVDFFDTDFF